MVFCVSICQQFSSVYSFCHFICWWFDLNPSLRAFRFSSIFSVLLQFLLLLLPLLNPPSDLVYCPLSYVSASRPVFLSPLLLCCVSPLLQIYGVFARYPKVPAAPEGAVSGPYPASDLHWLGSEVLPGMVKCACEIIAKSCALYFII